MAELSPECLQQEPPFALVGLDIVGPREVVIHWTKRWTILFICNSIGSQQVPQAESLHFEGFSQSVDQFSNLNLNAG